MRDKDTKLLEEKYKLQVERYGRRGEDYDYSDADVGPSSPTTETLELYPSNEDEEPIQADFKVEFDVEPTEYEGGFVFYQGGVNIEDVKSEQEITIDGKVYPAGTDVSEFFQYMDWYFGDDAQKRKQVERFYEDLAERIQESGVKVPKHHYPSTR